MKRNTLFIVILFFILIFSLSQAIASDNEEEFIEEWVHTFSYHEFWIYNFDSLRDGDYIVSGSTAGDPGRIGYLRRIKEDGEKIWEMSYTQVQQINFIMERNTGGFLAIGQGWDQDGALVSLLYMDDNGFIESTENIKHLESGMVYRSTWIEDVKITSDGGFIITGSDQVITSWDPRIEKLTVFLMKIDSTGSLEWVHNYPESEFLNEFDTRQVLETNDGGYLIAGVTKLNNNDIGLIKTNHGGIIQWEENYGHTQVDRFHAVIELENGGYLISGFLRPVPDKELIWLVNVNRTGNKQSDIQRELPNDIFFHYYGINGKEILNGDNGTFYNFITLFNSNNHKDRRLHIIKINSQGNSIIYNQRFNFSTISEFQSIEVFVAKPSDDNNFLICGYLIRNYDQYEYFFAKIKKQIKQNQIPSIHFTNLENNDVIQDSKIISGSALDSDGYIERVEIKFDSDSWIQVTGTNSWSYDWDTTSVSNGQYTIYARSYDGEAYSETISLGVNVQNIIEEENIPPIVSIIDPGDPISSITTISGTASDQDGEIQSVQIQIDSGQWITVSWTTTWSYNFDTTTMSNGYHTINARSYDGEDYSTITSIAVNIDNIIEDQNEIPTLTILSHDNQEKVDGTVTLSGSASDIEDAIQKVEIKVDNNDWVSVEGTDVWVYKLDTTALSDGQHFIYMRAWDGSEYSEMKTLTLDVNNGNNDSPGFEIFIIFLSLLVFLYAIKTKIKYR